MIPPQHSLLLRLRYRPRYHCHRHRSSTGHQHLKFACSPTAPSNTAATYSTFSSVILLWNGIATLVRPAASVTGKSPSLYPNCSR